MSVKQDGALALKQDFPSAWYNRSIAAGNSDGQKKHLFPTFLPPTMQALGLEKRGYEGRIATIHEGLKYFSEETEGWGLLHSYLGHAHRNQARRTESPYSFWYKASLNYKTALQRLTSDRFPESHLDVLQKLIEVLLALNETDEAETLLSDGGDLLRRLLSDPTRSPKQQRSLIPKQARFNQISVDFAVQAEDTIAVLQLAEHGKNTFLRWMLEIDEPPEVTFTEIREWLPPTTALLNWHLSPSALTTFIVLPGHDRPQIIPAPVTLPAPYAPTVQTNEPDQRPATLKQLLAWETWLNEWNQEYQSYSNSKDQPQCDQTWRTQMGDRLDALRQILNISAIENLLNTDITQLILVPHRDLHCFPLHTFFNLPCTYLPSIYLGLSTQCRLNNCDRILLVENPKNEAISGNGTFIEIESALIQRLLPAEIIPGENATAQQVIAALSQPHRLLHFTGHGKYNNHNPSRSCLYLTGTDQLTLATLANLDLSAYELVCLAACETGVTGRQTISDEYSGLRN